MIISAPITNVVAYVIIGVTSGWMYSAIVLAMTVVMVAVQFGLTLKTRALQGQQSMMADDSMKLVNDMVTGIRTIKCYGWEQHYIDKLNEVRDQ